MRYPGRSPGTTIRCGATRRGRLRNGPSFLGSGRIRGFTLMEVILAITMVALIMTAIYGTLFATMNARDQIEKESLKARTGQAILKLLERDLTAAWCMNIHDNDVFLGEDYTINGQPADCLHFIATTDSTDVEDSDEEKVRSDLTEVSYRLRENPTAADFLQLWRRQDFHVDNKIAEGGTYQLIYDRINSLQIYYYKDLYEGADRLEEWDAKTRNRLPAAVEIYLSIQIDPRLAGYTIDDMERPTLDYHRIFYLPDHSELTMAVRPVIPTFVEPGTDPNAGGDGDEQLKGGGGPGGPGTGGDGQGGGLGDKPPKDGGGPGGDFNPGGDLPDLPPDIPKNNKPPPGKDMDISDLIKLLNGYK